MLMRYLAIVCCGLAVALPSTSRAVTLTYHWVGAPAKVSNFPADDRPLFSTGTVKIQTTGSLAGRTIKFDSEDTSNPLNTPVETSFAINSRFPDDDPFNSAGGLTFDQNGEIVDWFISHAYSVSTTNSFVVATDREMFGFRNPFVDISEQVYSRVLPAKGYVMGTSDYERLASGCWAVDPGQDCDDGVWSALLLSNGRGAWIKDGDPLALADLLDRTTALALANPPRSYYDIPPAPIPVPAPILLLATALAGLGLAARKHHLLG